MFEEIYSVFDANKEPSTIGGEESFTNIAFSRRVHTFPFSAHSFTAKTKNKTKLVYKLITSRVGNLIYREYQEKEFFKALKEKQKDKYLAYFVSKVQGNVLPSDMRTTEVFLFLDEALSRTAKDPTLKYSPKSIHGLTKEGKFKVVAKCNKTITNSYWKVKPSKSK